MSNGFDDACFLVGTKIFGVAIFFNKHNLQNTVIDQDDLIKIDIRERYDIDRILSEVEKLPIMKKFGETLNY